MSDVINEGSQAFNIAGLNTPTGYLNQRPNAEIWNTEEAASFRIRCYTSTWSYADCYSYQ
jgi:hypothetical protein